MDRFNLVLRFRAPDRPGIIAAVTSLLAQQGCDVRDAQIFGDSDTGRFFVRTVLTSPVAGDSLSQLLQPMIDDLALECEMFDLAERPRVVIAVSKFGHCLVDLIHKTEIGQLPIEIVAVISNHETMRSTVEWHNLPYHHLPMSAGKEAQEAAFNQIIADTRADLVVLARYMQVLSNDFAANLRGRCINIHHSFLPSFKGAKPYHQAYDRGVKLIGATAHYVTAELDEGPIIEQDVRRVTHAATADDMVATGRDVEASVLSRAVRWHAEHRVFLNGKKTVVL
jgi:formyltetrahydrofolate deformylase